MGKLRERIADPIASKLTREEREEERKERDEGSAARRAAKPAVGQHTAR